MTKGQVQSNNVSTIILMYVLIVIGTSLIVHKDVAVARGQVQPYYKLSEEVGWPGTALLLLKIKYNAKKDCIVTLYNAYNALDNYIGY